MNKSSLRARIVRMGSGAYEAARIATYAYRRCVMFVSRLAGYRGDTVVFVSFDARSYNDNPRYICEALHRMRPNTRMVWMFRNPEAKKPLLPAYVEACKWMSVRSLAELARARVTVSNNSFRPFFRFKKPMQVYVQTWHGDRAFKKVGFDMHPNKTFLLEMECDLGLVGSDYGQRQFRSAFRYRGELLRAGYPRNDILVHPDPALAARVRQKLGIEPGERILLYAPTFRYDLSVSGRRHRAGIDLGRTLKALARCYGGQWVCLYRAHYLSAGLDVGGAQGRIINASGYEEMAELLLIADVLITDYSASAGDFALTGRPIFLFQDDLENYQKTSRELYFDMRDSPYLVADTQQALEALIARTSWEDAERNDREILDFYATTETGEAAQRACEYIIRALDHPPRGRWSRAGRGGGRLAARKACGGLKKGGGGQR